MILLLESLLTLQAFCINYSLFHPDSKSLQQNSQANIPQPCTIITIKMSSLFCFVYLDMHYAQNMCFQPVSVSNTELCSQPLMTPVPCNFFSVWQTLITGCKLSFSGASSFPVIVLCLLCYMSPAAVCLNSHTDVGVFNTKLI